MEFGDKVEVLNPYSVLPRYPGFDVTAQDAVEALEIAGELRDNIRQALGLSSKPL